MRDARNQRLGLFYRRVFSFLIFSDVAFFVLHVVLLAVHWRDREEGNTGTLTELALAATHFVTNSIAIVDLFVHLCRFENDEECSFEPAKSTNAFLYSCIGTYADLAACSISTPGSTVNILAWALFAESAASAIASVGCYVWGASTIRVCAEKHRRAHAGAKGLSI